MERSAEKFRKARERQREMILDKSPDSKQIATIKDQIIDLNDKFDLFLALMLQKDELKNEGKTDFAEVVKKFQKEAQKRDLGNRSTLRDKSDLKKSKQVKKI